VYTDEDRNKAVAYGLRARCYRRLGDHQRAIADFTEALRRTPYSEDYTARGGEYYNISEYDKAKDDLKRAIELDPTFDLPFYILGRAIEKSLDPATKLQSLRAGIENYSQAIELNPKYGNAYFCRADAYQELGQKSLALKDYDQVLMLDGDVTSSV
jgi:tetratricopeptide (TPR) repeat protein